MNKVPLKNLFLEIGHPLPSETKSRQTVATIAETFLQKIRSRFIEEKIFVVTDESDVRGQKFVNTLIDLLKEPTKTYLVESNPIYESLNVRIVKKHIDDILKEFKIERKNFMLLISDAAHSRQVRSFEIFSKNCKFLR